jgi:uncharacterized membrane protein YeaQ/YmgE (transglycosylase-associated protein family)
LNPFLWCAVGAGAGWLAGFLMPAPGAVRQTENLLVGIFGAFIGGEFLGSFVDASAGFHASSLGLAIAGAAGMLALLGVMRRVVGPLQSQKRKKARP